MLERRGRVPSPTQRHYGTRRSTLVFMAIGPSGEGFFPSSSYFNMGGGNLPMEGHVGTREAWLPDGDGDDGDEDWRLGWAFFYATSTVPDTRLGF